MIQREIKITQTSGDNDLQADCKMTVILGNGEVAVSEGLTTTPVGRFPYIGFEGIEKVPIGTDLLKSKPNNGAQVRIIFTNIEGFEVFEKAVRLVKKNLKKQTK